MNKKEAGSNINSRRGQITLFIIIGIVLLISVATIIYFYQQRVTEPIKRTIAVPEEVQAIYDYVATCTDQIGKEGLILMGTQGGFITLPPAIANNPNAHIKADPLGVAKTPYWYYEGEDRTPTLANMQRELELHIKNNLENCVDNFQAFQEFYTITPTSPMVPVVTLTDTEVIIQVKWPLEIRTQDKVTQLTEFISSFPVKLKPMYEMADKVMKLENREGWFENLTIDLMSANPEIPLSGMEFKCGARRWQLQTIKKEMQNMLVSLLPSIRIANTNYPPPQESERTYARLKDNAQDIKADLIAGKEPNWPENTPADVFEMNRMMLDAGIPKTNLKAAFVYQQDWPLFINAQPNQGGTLSTAQAKGPRKYTKFLCINQWHFAYDTIYPIKMMIKDDTAFRGEGYTFQMAFPVIIEDNKESRELFGLRRFQIPDMGEEYCNTYGTQKIDVRAIGFEEGSITAEELDAANVTFKCVNQECNLGQTYSDGSGAIRLTAYLPEGCANPTIQASKQGYLPGEKQRDKELMEIMLTKLKSVNYSIQVHPYYEEPNKENPTKATNKQWLDSQTYSTFTKTMHATISLSIRDQNHDQYKEYPQEYSTGTYDVQVPSTEIDFVWGDAQYDIDILLFKGDTPVGGYHAQNITIKYEDIAGANEAVFHVIEYRPLPTEEYQQAGMFFFLYERGEKEGQSYATALRPTFK